ncbi:MAG: trigger factor [Bdellovibrionales bacterium]
MKTSLEKTSNLGRKLTIEVPAEKVSSAFQKVYMGLQKNANIKGFRKGKAPLTIIKKMYSDKAKQDVLEDLINEAYSHALNEHTLKPISQPMVDFKDLDEANTFNFTAEFEIRPEVKLQKIEDLAVEKEKLEFNESEIDKTLNDMLERKATNVPVFENRNAIKGDVAEIDFVGTIDGKPLEGGSMNGHKLELGSNSFIPGFEDGIIGMTVGSNKMLNLKFPENYGNAEISGKDVQFNVTLKALLKKSLPTLDDAFAASIQPGKTLADLKNDIKENLTQRENQRIHSDLKKRLLKVLAKENPLDVPTTLKTEQKKMLIADVEKRMTEQGMTESELKEYVTKWDKDFDESAEFMIQSSFLINALADKFELHATEKDYDKKIEDYAAQIGVSPAMIRDYYAKNRENGNQALYQITEEKVVDYLISKSKIKEVPKSKLKDEDSKV